ncbi:MAG: hypothetical protein IKP25_02595, partial [Ruminococcus sp.]|nr:hypothetical protein [Ruminococcus sp.]
MKRVFAAFAAVVMLFSATACGDSDSESETAKGKSIKLKSTTEATQDSEIDTTESTSAAASQEAETESSSANSISADSLNGTYRYADIDGFGYLEDGPLRNYVVYNNGRFESFFCDDNTYSDKDFYKKYGYVCKTTGTYEVSDGIISSKFDDLNTKEDLFKMFPSCIEDYESLDDSEKEAFIEEQIKYHKVYFKDAEANEKMAIDKEKNIAYQIDKPHYWRQAAYNNLIGSILTAFIYDFIAHTAQSDSYAADKYYIFSSVDEFNNNVSNEERKYLEELIGKIDVLDIGWYT